MRSSLLLLYVVVLAVAPVSAADNTPGFLPANIAAKPLGFDAEGTLQRNHAAGPGQSPYALLDSAGRVIFFVEPKWGVKLAPHAGRRVKVNGFRSQVLGQTTPVLVAQAIEPLVKDSPAEIQVAAPVPAPSFVPTAPITKTPTRTKAAPVTFQEELPEAMTIDPEAEIIHDGEGGDIVEESCDAGEQIMGPMTPVVMPMNRWSGLYVRAEYLYWWADGLYAPALVTTSPNGTARANAGVLGTEGVEVLFGNAGLNNEATGGGRISGGLWFDDCRDHAIEGDYWGLGTINNGFSQESEGNPILARPFFDINNAQESSELVAFPNLLAGSVVVDPVTHVQGAGLRKRWNLCGCLECDPCQPLCCTGWSFDVTAGYRFMRLDDTISITEDLTSLDTANPGSFLVFDQFKTQNTFNGGELGTVMEGRRGRLSWEGVGRVAVGTTHSVVNINGFTDITPAGGRRTRSFGGLLTQRTNIGTYDRDELSVIPELSATMGWQITPVWRVTLGYTFIYWSNVVRAGQQIDRDVNTNLLPPEADPFTGVLRPRFAVNDTDFWVQGINVGLDARW